MPTVRNKAILRNKPYISDERALDIMSVAQSVRQGAKWLIASSTSTQILQFLFGIILARLLVPEDFGLIVTIQVFTGIAGYIAGGGMGQGLVRSSSVEPEDFQIVFTMQLLIGVCIYSFFFIIAPWFSGWFNNPVYEDLLRVSALSFLLRPFVSINSAWLNREMLFKQRAIAGFISLVGGSSISVLMAVYGYGVWSLTIGGLMGSVILAFLLMRITPKNTSLRLKKDVIRKYAGYGLKVSGNDIISYLRKQTSNVIISRIAGAAAVGLFNKASSLAKLPFTAVSGPIFMPVMREMSKVQDNMDRSRYLFFKMISLLVLYTLPIYVGLFFLAESFIYVIYGEKWVIAAEPLKILSLAGLLYCVGHPCGVVLAAHNRLGREMVVHFIGLVGTIFATVFGLNWGLEGVAWGIVATELLTLSLMFYLVVNTIHTSLFELVKVLTQPLALNALLVIALWCVSTFFSGSLSITDSILYMTISGIIGGGVFLLSFLFLPFKSISSESERWKTMLRIRV